MNDLPKIAMIRSTTWEGHEGDDRIELNITVREAFAYWLIGTLAHWYAVGNRPTGKRRRQLLGLGLAIDRCLFGSVHGSVLLTSLGFEDDVHTRNR